MDTADRVQIAHDIRRTTKELKDRGLLVAAKWYIVPQQFGVILTVQVLRIISLAT